MATVPRRLPPGPEERLSVVANRMAPGSDAGTTRFARPVTASATAQSRAALPPSAGEIPVGTASGDQAIAIGHASNASGSESVALGDFANATGDLSYCLGTGDATADGAMAIGTAEASGVNSIALGATNSGTAPTASADGAIAIGVDSAGTGAVSNTQDTIVLGTDLHATQLNLRSPDGTVYRLVVANGGALSATPV